MSSQRITEDGRLYLSVDILRRIFATFIRDIRSTLFAAAVWKIHTSKSCCKGSCGCCTPYSFPNFLVVLDQHNLNNIQQVADDSMAWGI